MKPDKDLKYDTGYVDLLEIDTFRVVKDTKWAGDPRRGQNNYTEHWIFHVCDAYLTSERVAEHTADRTGAFDSEEISNGTCAYCGLDIPEPIIALWSMLEWEDASKILHSDIIRMGPFL